MATVSWRRISVIGTSGAGKSVLAAALADHLGVPYVELDALRHGPGWTETPDDLFRAAVAERVVGEAWVIDGNYPDQVRDLIWERATAVVWLDFDRPVVMRRVIWRSFLRAATRQELWNGNRERVRSWVDHDHPIRWSWSGMAARRVREETMLAEPRWSSLHVVRLRTPDEAKAWWKTISSEGASAPPRRRAP